MQTKIRKLDGLPIEEPLLDETGMAKQKELAALVLQEYAETGMLSGSVVREKVEQYETEIVEHVIE
ncbi:MAG: hypothetical protein RRZ24_07245 [Clostridia bacterium]